MLSNAEFIGAFLGKLSRTEIKCAAGLNVNNLVKARVCILIVAFISFNLENEIAFIDVLVGLVTDKVCHAVKLNGHRFGYGVSIVNLDLFTA